MKNKILIIGAFILTITIFVGIYFYINKNSSYNNLLKIYSNNYDVLESQIIALNNDAYELMEKTNKAKNLNPTEMLIIIDNCNKLDFVQRIYSIMIQNYQTNSGVDFKDADSAQLDYGSNLTLTFYHDISTYLSGLLRDANQKNDFTLSQKEITKIEDIIYIFKEMNSIFNKLQDAQISGLTEREKLYRRVLIQMDLRSNLLEMNNKASSLIEL